MWADSKNFEIRWNAHRFVSWKISRIYTVSTDGMRSTIRIVRRFSFFAYAQKHIIEIYEEIFQLKLYYIAQGCSSHSSYSIRILKIPNKYIFLIIKFYNKATCGNCADLLKISRCISKTPIITLMRGNWIIFPI